MATSTPQLNLRALAHMAMLEEGFTPDLPSEAATELHRLEQNPPAGSSLRDQRSLLWSSIDNAESRDLDQIEYAERLSNGDIRLQIGIADVDSFVLKGQVLDGYAAGNTTSVYTGVATFPMLPEELSTDLTSLLGEKDRLAVVMEMLITNDGSIQATDVYRAVVRNHARLTYEPVGEWLEDRGPAPSEITSIPGLEEQLRLQNESAGRLHGQRQRSGALDFETIEAAPVMSDGQVVDLRVPHKNQARYLIENFMVAANSAMASLLEKRGIPSIQRVVRTPKRWSRIVEIARGCGVTLPADPDPQALSNFLTERRKADPAHFPDLSLSIVKLLGPGEYMLVQPSQEHEGHFGLAVHNYTHSTAPNRRYADLVIQRLLKALIQGSPAPYTTEELASIAAHCTERENAARKVERRMRKAAAAVLFGRRVGETFKAVVTGVSHKGTFVRTIAPPVEGRVIRGEHGLDVGDRVKVRLMSTEPEKGFIDFERA